MSPARRPLLQACTLFLALLAVTLDFVQPLAHAASLRNGGPGLAWFVLCRATSADPERADADNGSTPVPARSAGFHDCCLGLAHAPPLLAPPVEFISLPPIETASVSPLPADQRPSIAIRDGPPRPRGPPFFPMT
ncbi:MAG: hypothetical protein KIS73_12555 [Enhydrobacter sp.]|nr:hypothetical protein [Enhydrobacter sp.]